MEGGNKMTREEQILNKAIDYSEIEENFLEYDDCGDVCDDKTFVEKAFIEGAKWADRTMIARAVEWLQDSVYDRYIEMHEDNIEDFRKAMED
jgi:hypothetical protein